MAVDRDGGCGGTCRVVLGVPGCLERAVSVTLGWVLPHGTHGPFTHCHVARQQLPSPQEPQFPKWGGGPRDAVCRQCLLHPHLAAAPGELGEGWGGGGVVPWHRATRARGLRCRRCLLSQRACARPSGRRDCAVLSAWGGLARRGGPG